MGAREGKEVRKLYQFLTGFYTVGAVVPVNEVKINSR